MPGWTLDDVRALWPEEYDELIAWLNTKPDDPPAAAENDPFDDDVITIGE